MKSKRISIPPDNQKLWRYLTEGLTGRARADSLPSYPCYPREIKRSYVWNGVKINQLILTW